MLTYVNIDLFSSPAQTLVNTVNVVGVMGKGVAAKFKKLYPKMFEEYRRLCDEGKFDVGMLYVYRTPNKIIVNFPTKKHWRQPSQLSYIESGLRKFVDRYGEYGIASVSFPQLGCGNGELHWEQQVRPVMERYLSPLPIPVYVHIRPRPLGFVPERLDPSYEKEAHVERHRISLDELWQDLTAIVDAQNAGSEQLALFGPKVAIDAERILFEAETGAPGIVYKEDLETLWNTLRLKGTLRRADLLRSVQGEGVADSLFRLLLELEYVSQVRLRESKEKKASYGLSYTPKASLIDESVVDLSA